MASWYVLFPVFVVLYVFTTRLLHKIRNLPPGPGPSFPIIGHLYLLGKPLHRTLAKLAAQHGPILLYQLGYRRVLVVSNTSAAEECLAKNDILFANRPRLAVAELNHDNLLWAPHGDHWRNLRRICALELLSTHRLQLFTPIRTGEINSMIHGLRESQNRPVEMYRILHAFAGNVIMMMIAGKRYYGDNLKDVEEAKRFRQLVIDSLDDNTNLGDFLPLIGRLGFGRKKVLDVNIRYHKFMQDLIDQASSGKSSVDDEKEGRKCKTMIEVLLSLQETEPKYYTNEMIRSLMFVLFAGGVDTISTAMEWGLSLLINHPNVLKKAQIEIDNQVGHDRLLKDSDLAELPYLRCVVNEVMRMYPPLPLLVPHESSQECTVGGYYIPGGTMLMVNVWAIQNDSKTWLDPEKFVPERHHGKGINSVIKDGVKLMPFGSGRRSCPAEVMGTRMVSLAMGSLIQCFDWTSVDGNKVDMTDNSAVTVTRVVPLQAVCRVRSPLTAMVSKI